MELVRGILPFSAFLCTSAFLRFHPIFALLSCHAGGMIPVPLMLLAAPAPVPEAQKIEALIQAVAALQGAVFIRNGTEHTPREAADHLRLKWKNAGKRVKTAPDFIQYCATGSSMSGRPYEIRLKDGRTVPARDWLWTELKRMEAKP